MLKRQSAALRLKVEDEDLASTLTSRSTEILPLFQDPNGMRAKMRPIGALSLCVFGLACGRATVECIKR